LKTAKLNEKQEENASKVEILRELHKRIVKSFLDIIILTNLNDQNTQMGGYDIMSFIHEEFDTLLSAGTIYAFLYSLERDGLIKGEYATKRKIYMLTEKGKIKIKTFLDAKPRILDLIANLFI